jgi:peptidoglycan-associated lipoprotein
MYMKVLSLFAAVVLMAACSSTPKDSGNANGAGLGNNGMTTGSGIGNGSVRPGTQEDLAANVGDRVFFQYDHTDLTPEGRATLDRQAAWLKQYSQLTVTIEGHCDERGTREYNIGLGNRRATAVKNYLVALGISSSRVAIISYGKERPAVVGDSEDAFAQNRRGVTIVN